MATCPRCKLGVDRFGLCPPCQKEAAREVPWLKCIYCRCPFRPGKPHGRCLQRMLRRASRGQGPPSYWKIRDWKRTARSGRTYP